MHVQTLLKSFHSRKLIIHPSELITVEFEPVRGHINWAQLESSGISDSTKGLLMHLFPAGSVKLVRTVLKHYQLGTFLEQVRRASQSVNLAQWGDNTSAESNSHTFYSGPAYFIETMYMLKDQTRQLLQTCAEDCSLDRNVMLAELETAYEDLQANFVNWDALEHAKNTGNKNGIFLFLLFLSQWLWIGSWTLTFSACSSISSITYSLHTQIGVCFFSPNWMVVKVWEPNCSGTTLRDWKDLGVYCCTCYWNRRMHWSKVPCAHRDVWSMESAAHYKYAYAVSVPFPLVYQKWTGKLWNVLPEHALFGGWPAPQYRCDKLLSLNMCKKHNIWPAKNFIYQVLKNSNFVYLAPISPAKRTSQVSLLWKLCL